MSNKEKYGFTFNEDTHKSETVLPANKACHGTINLSTGHFALNVANKLILVNGQQKVLVFLARRRTQSL